MRKLTFETKLLIAELVVVAAIVMTVTANYMNYKIVNEADHWDGTYMEVEHYA